MKTFYFIVNVYISLLLISKAEVGSIVDFALSATSKDDLISRYKSTRLDVVDIDSNIVILTHRRGSGIISWEYYMYVKKDGFYKISWIHFSKSKVLFELKSDKTLVIKNQNSEVISTLRVSYD